MRTSPSTSQQQSQLPTRSVIDADRKAMHRPTKIELDGGTVMVHQHVRHHAPHLTVVAHIAYRSAVLAHMDREHLHCSIWPLEVVIPVGDHRHLGKVAVQGAVRCHCRLSSMDRDRAPIVAFDRPDPLHSASLETTSPASSAKRSATSQYLGSDSSSPQKSFVPCSPIDHVSPALMRMVPSSFVGGCAASSLGNATPENGSGPVAK